MQVHFTPRKTNPSFFEHQARALNLCYREGIDGWDVCHFAFDPEHPPQYPFHSIDKVIPIPSRTVEPSSFSPTLAEGFRGIMTYFLSPPRQRWKEEGMLSRRHTPKNRLPPKNRTRGGALCSQRLLHRPQLKRIVCKLFYIRVLFGIVRQPQVRAGTEGNTRKRKPRNRLKKFSFFCSRGGASDCSLSKNTTVRAQKINTALGGDWLFLAVFRIGVLRSREDSCGVGCIEI